MIKILFVCHGNICRSPMAESIFRDMVKKQGLQDSFYIASAATSTEEIGNPVHPGTQSVLRKQGISAAGKYAVQLKREDYGTYDYFIGMDLANIKNMVRILGRNDKISMLLDFTGKPGEVADPWYTGDFDRTFMDVSRGCRALLDKLAVKEAEA